MGKYGRTFGMVAALVPLMCACGMDAAKDLVAAMAATNHLETWEGEYHLTNIVEFANDATGRLFACIHVRNDVEYGGHNCGTLVDVYWADSNCARRIYAPETDIKGVTPVLQRIGSTTNHPYAAYWMLWRHLGNGGLQTYSEYAFTNGVFSPIRHLHLLGWKANKRWYLEEYDAQADNYVNVPVSNFCWEAGEAIWENTNTVYRYIPLPSQ